MARKQEQPFVQGPHSQEEKRQKQKRVGKDGKPGKAGRVDHKGGAPTSNKATGGKGAA